ncbi:MAG TPA: hypothetical protein VHW70_06610 [Edaphobacter sp.]|jgi:hypothetical protein|nr:hypothetical protein [Edaphobacter sp.]
MLNSDEKKLRWWGIDLRPRLRRRVVVCGTYFVLFVLMDFFSTSFWYRHPYWDLLLMVVSIAACERISVFRRGGVVKSFEDRPALKLGYRGKVLVNGLDEWAQHFYDVASFEEANDEQKADLLRRYRVGTYMFPAKAKPWVPLDEREIAERDSASRWALQRIAVLLAVYMGTTAADREPLQQMAAAAMLWGFLVLAITLPQARVLWTEHDPREVGEESGLLASEA